MIKVKFWLLQVLLALDQFFNAFLGGYADETVSAHCYRRQWITRMAIINFIFRDKNHCRNSYLSELNRNQLPPGYTQRSLDPSNQNDVPTEIL